jgi:hypothetical protein
MNNTQLNDEYELQNLLRSLFGRGLQYGELRMKWSNDPKYVPDRFEYENQKVDEAREAIQRLIVGARIDENKRVYIPMRESQSDYVAKSYFLRRLTELGVDVEDELQASLDTKQEGK